MSACLEPYASSQAACILVRVDWGFHPLATASPKKLGQSGTRSLSLKWWITSSRGIPWPSTSVKNPATTGPFFDNPETERGFLRSLLRVVVVIKIARVFFKIVVADELHRQGDAVTDFSNDIEPTTGD